MKKDKVISAILIIVIFIIIFLVVMYTPIINKYRNNGNLIINEIMSSNKNTIIDSYGNTSDYIEIYNGYDYDINLSGYYLSDDNFDTKKWKFPNVTIKSKDYLVVYASGLDKYDKELHTNFKLDDTGEIITLSNKNGISLSKIYYSKTLEDTSYGYDNGKYVYYYNGTPNKENNGNYSDKPISVSTKKDNIYITEYITNNITAYKSNDNNYYSVVEIYNGYDYDINLSGYYLSDKQDNPYKYIFPDITIKTKDYLVVYTSGLDKYDKEIHTNFKLDNSDNVLILSDKYKNEISKIYLSNLDANISSGYYNGKWYYYKDNSIGIKNENNYIDNNQEFSEKIIINEVSAIPREIIEIKNISNDNINLSNYSIGDKSGKKTKLPNIILKPNSFYLVYGSDNYSYKNGLLHTGFHINNSNEKIYLYDGDSIVDSYSVGKLINNVSSGLNSNGNRVFYKDMTFGNENSKTYYHGYIDVPKFNIDGGYVDSGAKIKLSTASDSEIYYTLDGTFPNKNSKKYNGEINIDKTTVIKAIAYKDGYLESDVVSRTFVVGREHDLSFISLSTSNNDLYGSNGLLSNYYSDMRKKISFEFYEKDGTFGVGFTGEAKLTGMDSRKRDQKSIAIYLKKEYGLNEITYPFFKDGSTYTYSSFTLRNAGEDPYGIRIQDTVMTYALKGKMDIDMQDYRPVVVYINGKYYGLYNMREKLNGGYIESKYGLEKGQFDLIKYSTAVEGSTSNYNKLVNYISTHDPKDKEVYEYLKTQIDMQELCNYLIVESYYGNTDLGNIRYWKAHDGKWRWMLYDLDWSLWNTNLSIGYPVSNERIPAATYLYSTYTISRRLYRNSEFRDMYLSTLAKHLKDTFNPTRMNQIVDELAKEIETEMPYHIERWSSMHTNMNGWKKNVSSFKNKLNNRYNNVLKRIKSDFNLSNDEYNKYFGNLN